MATHYVARDLAALGHDVKQVPPSYAKPFRQGHKNDFRDAFAGGESVQRPTTLCVPIKSYDPLDLQALHRVRTRLVGNRTAIINLMCQEPSFTPSLSPFPPMASWLNTPMPS